MSKRNLLSLLIAVVLLSGLVLALPVSASAASKATATIKIMQVLITADVGKPSTVEIYAQTDAKTYPAIVDVVLPADATITSVEEFGTDTTKRTKIDYRPAPSDLDTTTDATFQVKLEKQTNFVVTLNIPSGIMDGTSHGGGPLATFGLIAPSNLTEIAYGFVAPKNTTGIGKDIERFPDSKKGEVYGIRYPNIERGLMSTAGIAFVEKDRVAEKTAEAAAKNAKKSFSFKSLITFYNVLYALIALLIILVLVIVYVVLKPRREADNEE